MLLLDLMNPDELEESIALLRKKLFDHAAKYGFANDRTMEISRRLDLYMERYKDIKKS